MIFFTLLILTQVVSGCVYNFTNTRNALPPTIRTIAFESVYDTTREALPHDYLWEELQRAFAADGRLLVADPKNADIFLRAWLSEANYNASGGNTLIGPQKDPRMGSGNPSSVENVTQLRDLRRTGKTSTEETLKISIDVQVFDLRRKKVIFERTYPLSTNYKIAFDEKQAPKESHILRYYESRDVRFKSLVQTAAAAVVRDFITGL